VNASRQASLFDFATAARQHVIGLIQSVNLEPGVGERDGEPARAAHQIEDG